MSLRERLGDFDAVNGKNASEYAQGRADELYADIKRPARRGAVMSDEAWKRKAEKEAKKYAEEKAKWEKDINEKQLARDQVLVQIKERVERYKKIRVID